MNPGFIIYLQLDLLVFCKSILLDLGQLRLFLFCQFDAGPAVQRGLFFLQKLQILLLFAVLIHLIIGHPLPALLLLQP